MMKTAETAESVLGGILDECLDRLGRGETVSLDEYASAHPDLADRLRELQSALALTRSAHPAAPDDTPELTGFRVVREVGRGGMGVVYEALDEALGRRVALKTLPAHLTHQPGYLARFRREAQTAARLHHTNIVPVFGVGEQDGVHYFVMQFIPGSPPPAGEAMDPRRVAELGAKLADALDSAHAQGVLHRDVKPSNVLIDEHGTPWLADFGLARAADGEDLTESGGFVGTLRYAPPERFAGKADERGDVYGLGATLYEWAVGRPAFADADPASLTKCITTEEPPRPRQVNPHVPRDLETVILKAMAKEPERRYPTASELADDLRRVLAGEPVRARRVSPLGRARRWAARNPAVAGLLVALGVVFAAGTAGVVWQWREAVDNAAQAEANAATAKANADRAEEEAREAKAARIQTLRRTRAFAMGMEKLPSHFTLLNMRKGAIPDPIERETQLKAIAEMCAAYEEFLLEPVDDPEVIALQARAAHVLSQLNANSGERDSSRARLRQAVSLIDRVSGEDDLRGTIYLAWGRVVMVDPDPALRAEWLPRVTRYLADRQAAEPANTRWLFESAKFNFAHQTALLKWEGPAAARPAAQAAFDGYVRVYELNPKHALAGTGRTDAADALARIYIQLGDLPTAAAIADRFDEWKQSMRAASILALCRKADRENPSGMPRGDVYGDRAMTYLLSMKLASFSLPGGKATSLDGPNLKPLADREDFQDLRRRYFADLDARRAVQPKK